MSEPVWLPLEVVLALHDRLLARFGGAEGIRDQGMLESALGKAQQLFHYGDPSVFDLAASYAFGVLKNHPFIDGNKRTGFMAAFTFLGVNGYDLVAPEEEAVVQTLGLAAGAIGEADYTAWLKAGSVKKE